MSRQDSKLQHANVVAAFENQDDADEALLGLRLTGFKDHRIGLYYPVGGGKMLDTLVQYHRLSASVIGFILGAAIAPWLGLLLIQWGYADGYRLDPFGIIVTSAAFGGLAVATIGGMTGFWLGRHDPFAPDVAGHSEQYVLTVDAGTKQDEAWNVIRLHGGHELPVKARAPRNETGAGARGGMGVAATT